MQKTIDAVIDGKTERVKVQDIVFSPTLANVPHVIFRLIIGGVLPVTPVLIKNPAGLFFLDFEIQ